MPKTSMDKNNLASAHKHQVRTSRQIADVKSEPKAHAKSKASYCLLRLRVFRSDKCHPFAAL